MGTSAPAATVPSAFASGSTSTPSTMSNTASGATTSTSNPSTAQIGQSVATSSASTRQSGGASGISLGGGGGTLSDCMAMWDKDTHMTRTQWRATCKRTLNGADISPLTGRVR
jgi:hypothetical protein